MAALVGAMAGEDTLGVDSAQGENPVKMRYRTYSSALFGSPP
jgi:hypothetical protein